MILDKEKQHALGLKGNAPIFSDSVMRYVVGVVTRERERLARVFDVNNMPAIAIAIRDTSLDDKVFKWNGPELGLDADPTSAEEREAKKANNPK